MVCGAKRLLGVLGVLSLSGVSIPAASARPAEVQIAIPAQSLDEALLEFSLQTGKQLLFSPDIVRGRVARPVVGRYPPLVALRLLLAGSGLRASVTPSGAFVIAAGRASASSRNARGRPAAAHPVMAMRDPVEIVVTARRREEVQQNVPQTVNAVTSQNLGKYNIQHFEELEYLVAGLDLSSGPRGFSNTASMRGVTFSTETAVSPTVEFYLNDAPVSSGYLFQSLFDTRQIEVLRGPQGTLRGRAAPSGAITLTTREPDLAEAGGYVEQTATTLGGIDANAALNVPIVPDRLALRIAGIVDHDDYDGVVSVNGGGQPWRKTQGGRVTLRFDPADHLSATIMYQHISKDMRTFPHVAGAGSPGGTFANGGYALPVTLPAGYNGPVLEPGDRRAVAEQPFRSSDRYDIVTTQLGWAFGGQRLVYVGSYARSSASSTRPGDNGNLIPDYDFDVTTISRNTYWTNELRLESEERVAGLFDYVVGAFRSDTSGRTLSDRGPTFGRGAFGSPLGAPVAAGPLTDHYNSSIALARSRRLEETSVYGNVTAHLGARTEFSIGGRYILTRKDTDTRFLRSGNGFALVDAGPDGCATAQMPSSLYPGFCDVAIAPGQVGSAVIEASKQTPFIYNIQLKHRFDDRFMLYASYGTSWREGAATVGITNGGIGSDGGIGDPLLRQLTEVGPERSRSIEIGFKATLFDRRARINVAAYRQTFDGLIFRGPPTYYLSDNGISPPSVVRFNFTSNADAVVKGVDVDFSFQPTANWSLAGGFSYARGRIDNDPIPCNDGDFDGRADSLVPTVAGFQAAGARIARCLSNRSVAQTPRWNLVLQSEYSLPISDRGEFYLRGLLTYYPDNPQDNETVTIGAYGVVSLFLGIRDANGAGDVALFVKNLTRTNRLVSRESIEVASDGGLGNYFGSSGYHYVRSTPRRQFGINIRYAFGAR
jgi:iron complex outermembrane receptor protein